MKKLDKNQLDEIGKALVRADAVSSLDVESIVADPALFDSIRARIAADKPVVLKRRTYVRPGIAAFASLTVVAAFTFVFVSLNTKPGEVAVQQVPVTPKTVDNIARFTEPDRVIDNERPPVVQQIRANKTSNRPIVKSNGPKLPEAQQVRYESNFYAVSYAGDPHETERGGRIVRVDIPRSTLFALGVDIPLENEAEVVKADLLVGPDGVTRGIRVVE